MTTPPPVPTEKQIRKAVRRSKTRAEDYLRDPEKSKALLETAVKKAQRNDDLPTSQPEFWVHIKAFIRLLRAYIKRDYRIIPWGSIVMVTAAVLYFVSPLDLLLDWIPFAGFIDDAAVLVFVTGQIRKDLNKFLIWEENRNTSNNIIDL